MLKGRRVGTFTAGITLIVFGLLFLIHSVTQTLDVRFIFMLWPIILILLGIEICLAYVFNRDDKLRYDGGAVAIIILLMLFAFGMSAIQFGIENYPKFGSFHIG